MLELDAIFAESFTGEQLRLHLEKYDRSLADSVPSIGAVTYEDYRYKVVQALCRHDAVAPFLRALAGPEAVRGRAVKLRRFLVRIEGAPRTADGQARVRADNCPYPGLAAYVESDAGIFLGRDDELDELDELIPAARWLSVEGDSGVGKSSLVAAGLLPRLRAEQQSWMVACMRPGRHPLDNLARAVRDAIAGPKPDLAEVRHQLVQDGSGLRSLVRQHTPKGARFLLLVDQLEEAQTFGEEEQTRSFDAAVAGALADEEPRFHLLTTIRADQVGSLFDGISELGGCINRSWVRRFVVPPIRRECLDEVIRGPARMHGVEFEAGLAESLRLEADELLHSSSEGCLPLLAHVLRELWRACVGGDTLTHSACARLGGLTGALARSAEELLRGLQQVDSTAPERIQKLLLALTAVDRQRRWTRRTIRRGRALEVLGGEKAEDLLAGLSGHVSGSGHASMRIIVTSSGDDEPRVDLIHEALLTRWSTLHTWLLAEEEAKRRTAELHEAAVQWDSLGGRHVDALPRGKVREVFLEAAPSEDERALDEAFQEALRDDVERERRAARTRRRRIIGAFAGLSVLAAMLGWSTYFAVSQRRLVGVALEQMVLQKAQAERAGQQADYSERRAVDAKLRALEKARVASFRSDMARVLGAAQVQAARGLLELAKLAGEECGDSKFGPWVVQQANQASSVLTTAAELEHKADTVADKVVRDEARYVTCEQSLTRAQGVAGQPWAIAMRDAIECYADLRSDSALSPKLRAKIKDDTVRVVELLEQTLPARTDADWAAILKQARRLELDDALKHRLAGLERDPSLLRPQDLGRAEVQEAIDLREQSLKNPFRKHER
ncbi:nSTAND1 domain-containing NTPase [Nannocystis punicea]|uniref:Novel STAND NTPase 1 domain-containing protein n=1 Tax=Nannocystis punicea TaxID=2995304 RepID=A0ABY7GW50_9BACT|nr:hypothetical protein [Nannocystis poenicansa]WAS91200.1 hypothetical protein O0S08_33855 [Nannocystis poenicansa]